MPERREHKAKTSSRGGTFGNRWYDTEFRAWRKDKRKSQRRQRVRRKFGKRRGPFNVIAAITLHRRVSLIRRINKERRNA